MCGIFGVRRTFRSERTAAAGLASLAWRGPDGSKLRAVGDWYLGVARLAISDPSADQPICDPVHGRAIAFNGAVTSAGIERTRPEVAARSQTGNDAELVLHRLIDDPSGQTLAAMSGPYAFELR